MNANLKLLLMVSLMLLTGCAHLNEGCNDYRKADTPLQKGTGLRAGGVLSGLLDKYEKASDPYRRLQKNDTLSVHLQQAFIKEFQETSPFTPDDEVQGEIAIVIKVFELSDNRDFNFGPKSAEEGRIVFYSPDVRKKQFLNFSAMPVYGPITYQGNPLALDLFIIELDSTDERTKNLLRTLASVGSAAYPPASPILSILDTVGTSFLQGNKNDVEFRYSMVLYPDKGYRTLDQAVLEVGNYVFIKQDDREQTIAWNELWLDEKSGRLCDNKTNTQPTPNNEGTNGKFKEKICNEFKKKTYFVVQINKGFDATSLDLSQNTFGKLLNTIDQQQKAEAAAYRAAIDGAMTEYANLQAKTKKFGDLRQTITDIETTSDGQSNRRKSLSTDIVTRLAEEIGSKDPAKLNTDQIDYLLDNLKRLVIKDSVLYAGINKENLKDAAFRTKIIETISDPAATGP
ncbi:MAG: hypothetical protein ACYC7J_18735 [Syntrophales bacterium]